MILEITDWDAFCLVLSLQHSADHYEREAKVPNLKPELKAMYYDQAGAARSLVDRIERGIIGEHDLMQHARS